MNRAGRLNGRSDRNQHQRRGDAGATCGIAVMAKASAPGRTKTRLVPPLTYEQAAALNTAFLQDVTNNMLLAGEHTGICGYAAYGPPGSEDFFAEILPPAIGLIDAWLPNFGDCLLHTIRQILDRGHGSAVVLNADSPNLPTALLVETAEILARPGDRAVLGPSTDGGYYLLGLKLAHQRLFEDIAWSTERVAEQTLARAKEIGLDVEVLPAWYDVDDIEDLRQLGSQVGRAPTPRQKLDPGEPHHASHTAALLAELALDMGFGARPAEPAAAARKHA